MQERVRAIIIENDSLLTIKRVKQSETYWVLPGGGIESGETKIEALMRECKEELGVDVKVGEFVFENDYFMEKYGPQNDYIYKCKIIGGKLGIGEGPEFQENNDYEGTHEIEWLKLCEIENFDLRPDCLKNEIENMCEKSKGTEENV